MQAYSSPLTITWNVWKALFLREAVTRLSTRRFAWVWLLVDPMAHIVYLMFLLTVVRVRVVGGIETPLWVMVGFLAYFMFKNPSMQSRNAINANRALFVYRQVKPVDCVLVRSVFEGLLLIVIALVLFTGAGLFGFVDYPADPIAVLEAIFGLWLIGLGFGLTVSVINELLPELGKIIDIVMTPLYLMSGVIFPLALVPSSYREWLMLNPLAHGIEAARLGFAPYYNAVPDLSVVYIYKFALVLIFFGIVLQMRFATQLAAK